MDETILVGAIITNVEITKDNFVISFTKDRQVGIISLFYSEWFYVDKIILDGVEITSSEQQFRDEPFVEKISDNTNFKKQLTKQLLLPFGWDVVERQNE